jgi:ABC-2 type transport system ATP-binding protein
MGELVCNGLGKVYSGGKRALSSVSFRIPTSGIFALIGRNGAGKTTLTRILSTLLEPSEGGASIDGLDVMADANRLRERMAVVPQEARAIAWMSPVQMITSYLLWRGLDLREAKRRALDSVEKVGMREHANKLNRNLSGGMKRKVLVAMVIASGADLIFLDEPTTGLDPISRKELWEILIDLSKDRFLFITTHYLEEAERVADRIGILDDGRLLVLGSMEELRAKLPHQYCLRVSAGADLPTFEGEKRLGRDGQVQVLTSQEDAMHISRSLLERKEKFSLNPVTLDDIFYQMVGRTISSEVEEEDLK